MVDNFDLLKSLYEEHSEAANPDFFLFGQILSRKKDGGKYCNSNNKVVKDLVFRTPEDFDKKKDEIIDLCNTFNARAYVNVNPRSYKEIAVQMAGLCLDHIRLGSECAARSVFSTACGRHKPRGGYWVVDVDDVTMLQEVENLLPFPTISVPTVNGVHFLTKGCDLRPLKECFPEIDVHKNNPTLLYFNTKGE